MAAIVPAMEALVADDCLLRLDLQQIFTVHISIARDIYPTLGAKQVLDMQWRGSEQNQMSLVMVMIAVGVL
jgi:hypothetical protein